MLGLADGALRFALRVAAGSGGNGVTAGGTALRTRSRFGSWASRRQRVFSDPPWERREGWGTIAGLAKLGLRVFLVFAAAQALLLISLAGIAALRNKLREAPSEGFPWEEVPEVELEGGAHLKLYPFGEKLYEAMFEEIEGATERIFVGTFIWKGDELGQRLVDALARKAREGVLVCVVFDGLANAFVPASFKRFPEEINALHFRPLWGPANLADPRNLLRYHRHEMSVDGRVAFLGGYNIGSLYEASWRDTHVRVRGEEAREVENAFVDFWNAHRTGRLPKIEVDRVRPWDPKTLVHRNDPYLRIFPIRAMYLEAINRASSHVYFTHAYFIPDRAMRSELTEAARRGVDVQILLPRASNHATVDWLARRHFDELLRAGVRIFAYENFMLHAKTATIDGVWSTVGSANIDHLSMMGHYEINLEVHGRLFARQMEEMFELDKTNASEVTLEEWENRPLAAKLAERFLDGLRPLV